jgi:hypothetical protein
MPEGAARGGELHIQAGSREAPRLEEGCTLGRTLLASSFGGDAMGQVIKVKNTFIEGYVWICSAGTF